MLVGLLGIQEGGLPIEKGQREWNTQTLGSHEPHPVITMLF